MGKKQAVHVMQVKREMNWPTYYAVKYKRSKCRYAKAYLTYVRARDELEAYIKVSINKEGVW
jgi:hypothetical protein